jgi:hypothetical protein
MLGSPGQFPQHAETRLAGPVVARLMPQIQPHLVRWPSVTSQDSRGTAFI